MAAEKQARTGLAVGLNKGHVCSWKPHKQTCPSHLLEDLLFRNPVKSNNFTIRRWTGWWILKCYRKPRLVSPSPRLAEPRVTWASALRLSEILSRRFPGMFSTSSHNGQGIRANHLLNSLAPYERRVIELLRNSKDKRARKLAKKRVCF